ncbi:dehydration-responsive element-binding protein 1B [Sorghum bicolor]|nr:dehydration-responsive element-binding protein 1B [Sorghum bicolor]|eukprot:XP_002462689.2 dehydration-responsive element-binding protein 1B [Sorghum bicolor]
MAIYTFPAAFRSFHPSPSSTAPSIPARLPHTLLLTKLLIFSESAMDTPSPSPTSSAGHDEYRTVWSAPPKKPAGRTKFRETRHPVYRGVRRRGTLGRWVCEVRVPGGRGSRLWLGTFTTPELAARAHDAAAIALSRRGACLNFADSAWLLPPLMPAALSAPELASAREVKDAVAEAVEAFRRCSVAEPTLSSPPNDTADDEEEEDDDDDAVSSPGAVPWNDAVFEFEDVFRFGGMVDAGSYYASLAQGLLVDPPDAAGAWREDVVHATADTVLWSY